MTSPAYARSSTLSSSIVTGMVAAFAVASALADGRHPLADLQVRHPRSERLHHTCRFDPCHHWFRHPAAFVPAVPTHANIPKIYPAYRHTDTHLSWSYNRIRNVHHPQYVWFSDLREGDSSHGFLLIKTVHGSSHPVSGAV
jgi:hypothetical protein